MPEFSAQVSYSSTILNDYESEDYNSDVLSVMGGMLADSNKTLPGLFGENAAFGFQWIRDYPYALPSLVNAVSLFIVTLIVFLFLEEVSRHSHVIPQCCNEAGERKNKE